MTQQLHCRRNGRIILKRERVPIGVGFEVGLDAGSLPIGV